MPNKMKWKNWQLHLVTFYRKYLQNMKYTATQACIFHLILLDIPSNLNKGVGFFLLNRQNPLSLTNVICWQSLTEMEQNLIMFTALRLYQKPLRESHVKFTGKTKFDNIPCEQNCAAWSWPKTAKQKDT